MSDKDKIVRSKDLLAEVNRERARRGEYKIPETNDASGEGNTLARMDKSWSSSPDFFIKLIKGEGKGQTPSKRQLEKRKKKEKSK